MEAVIFVPSLSVYLADLKSYHTHSAMDDQLCLICQRPLGNSKRVSKHHLIPKSRGGKHTDTILIHNICHQKIHSVFTEKELRDEFHKVEKLREHEEIRKFINWVAKKDINFYQTNKKLKR